MFGLSGTELAVILVLALLLLGPSKLPQVARTVGKGVRDFRRATDDLRHSVESEFYRMDDAERAKLAAAPSLKPPEGAPVPVAAAAAPTPDGAVTPSATLTEASAPAAPAGSAAPSEAPGPGPAQPSSASAPAEKA